MGLAIPNQCYEAVMKESYTAHITAIFRKCFVALYAKLEPFNYACLNVLSLPLSETAALLKGI